MGNVVSCSLPASGRAADTLVMCPAEVLRKLLGIVFLELVVLIAEEADLPQSREGGLARVRLPLLVVVVAVAHDGPHAHVAFKVNDDPSLVEMQAA